MVYRVFSTRNKSFLIKLFKAYIRPMLDYASTIWNPSNVGLARDIESVQRRYTKRLPQLRSLPYEARLEHLQLSTLEAHRKRADVIMAFKSLHGLLKIDPSTIGVKFSTASTRGHCVNLAVDRSINNTVKQSFCFRIGYCWNSLPLPVKSAQTLNCFKKLSAF